MVTYAMEEWRGNAVINVVLELEFFFLSGMEILSESQNVSFHVRVG